jgi:hypothetical protein
MRIHPEPLGSENQAVTTKAIKVSNKNTLIESHRYDDLRTKLQRDMRKWEDTLEEDLQDDEKILALKKTLLLFGSSGMKITGGGSKEPISASENKLPIAEYMSGHMGRVYAALPPKQGAETLKWISGEKEVVKARFAATHAAKVLENKVVEEKLSLFKSVTSGLRSILSSALGFAPRIHNGIDVAFGGKGKKYLSAIDEPKDVGVINDDGGSGHVYYNVNTGKEGDSFGSGTEGTAPTIDGYLGSHSYFGGADALSALEGEKFAVKFNKETLGSYLENKEMKNPEGPDCEKVKEAVEKLKKHLAYKKPFLERLGFYAKGEALLSKKDLAETCKDAGIVFVGKGKQMLTRFGKQCLDSGIKPQDNYNGANMVVSQENLSKIRAIEIALIPKEIIYFKPQDSVQCFIAQKPIYADIKSKEALRDNPQFGHETSVAIGVFYNAAAKVAEPDTDKRKEIINQTIGLINERRLAHLGIDINKFDILKDFEVLNGALKEFAPKNLERDLGITIGTKEAVQKSLKVMMEVATAAKERFDTPDKYLDLQKKFLESTTSNAHVTESQLEKIVQDLEAGDKEKSKSGNDVSKKVTWAELVKKEKSSTLIKGDHFEL